MFYIFLNFSMRSFFSSRCFWMNFVRPYPPNKINNTQNKLRTYFQFSLRKSFISSPSDKVYSQQNNLCESATKISWCKYYSLVTSTTISCCFAIYFVTCILCFKKVYKFKYICRCTHPLCWICHIVVLR